MSCSNLQKVPTPWLDYNDRKAAERSATERELSVGSNQANEWEVIGISSGDSSPPLPRDQSQNSSGILSTENKGKYPTSASLTTDQEQSGQDGGIVLAFCGGRYRMFSPISFSEIGTGRLIRTQLLLMIRLLSLFMHGISAGFSYTLREKISSKALLSELFIWLHLALLFLIPILLLSSVLTMRWNFLRDFEGEEQEPSKQGQVVWLSAGILYQVVMVLAQTELVRLLVMHTVPSLRPIVDHKGAELVYSLTNPFAAQRYLMVITITIDAVLSTVPLRYENGIFALLVFIPWTSVSLFIRPTRSSTAVKIAYLLGSFAIVLVIISLNVLMYKALSSCSERRKEQNNDRSKATLDIV